MIYAVIEQWDMDPLIVGPFESKIDAEIFGEAVSHRVGDEWGDNWHWHVREGVQPLTPSQAWSKLIPELAHFKNNPERWRNGR